MTQTAVTTCLLINKVLATRWFELEIIVCICTQCLFRLQTLPTAKLIKMFVCFLCADVSLSSSVLCHMVPKMLTKHMLIILDKAFLPLQEQCALIKISVNVPYLWRLSCFFIVTHAASDNDVAWTKQSLKPQPPQGDMIKIRIFQFSVTWKNWNVFYCYPCIILGKKDV